MISENINSWCSIIASTQRFECLASANRLEGLSGFLNKIFGANRLAREEAVI